MTFIQDFVVKVRDIVCCPDLANQPEAGMIILAMTLPSLHWMLDTGRAIGRRYPRHRASEFYRNPDRIEANVPVEFDVHSRLYRRELLARDTW